VVCPLCKLHLDSQQLSLQCPVIRIAIDVNGYRDNISYEIIHTVSKISEYREKNTDKFKQTEAELENDCQDGPCCHSAA
jgi:hypothetical protein